MLNQQPVIVLFSFGLLFVAISLESHAAVHGFQASHLFSPGNNKIEEKMMSSENSADQSFQEFIQSGPDSTVIGELKPNATELELMVLRNKIAETITSMQEMDKARGSRLNQPVGADCFIGVTKVERIPGKCRKVNDGLPICQAENYMAINTDCK